MSTTYVHDNNVFKHMYVYVAEVKPSLIFVFLFSMIFLLWFLVFEILALFRQKSEIFYDDSQI